MQKYAQVPIKFQLGDKVVYSGQYGTKTRGTVAGYEVRYIIRHENGPTEAFGRRAEYLEAAPTASEQAVRDIQEQIKDLQGKLDGLRLKLLDLVV